jgi:uncharacterized protein GlcG (DUF336 family)
MQQNIPRNAGLGILMLLAATLAAAAEPTTPAPGDPADATLISRAEATMIAQAALENCAARGMPASVIVVDANGYLRAAFSDDNAKFVGLSTSRRKAVSVLTFGVSTHELQDRVQSDQQFAAQYGADERYHFSAGGLPIYRQGKLVAVIAVGGARNVDEDCAYAGLRLLSWASTEAAGVEAP